MVESETKSLPLPTYASDRLVRPPTPPRESSVEEPRSGTLKRVLGLFRRTSSISTNPTPQSSAELPETPSGSGRKRVGWKEDLEDCIVPTSVVKGTDIFSAPLLERKPPKSILKPNQHHVPEDPSTSLSSSSRAVPQATTSANMIESAIQQLASTDRSARVDAYLILSELLKASESLPDVRVLKNNMDQLIFFIKRDLTDKADDDKPASSLAANALVLLCSFFYTTTIADLLPPEFAIYIVEHSIKAFEDPHASKDVARHLMFILTKQTFSSKTMSQERVGRLVKALHNIESGNLTGKRILDGRINIYRTLIRQSRSHMLSNHLWIQDLFTDMTSKLKETRSHAITFGLEAAFSFGMELKVTRAVSLLFETEVEEKGKYGHLFINRLKQMLQQDEENVSSAASIPQIWSVVVLFFQGRVRLLQQWAFLSDWLKIISDSFNQSDVSARKEALLAWNRLIFVVYSSDQSLVTSTTPSLKKLLPQALERQLRRENLRAPSLASLCCLLYYSFKAATTTTQLDTCWNDHVVRLVGNGLIPADVTRNPKKVKLALADSCLVLQWLFDHATARNYNQNRILENRFPASELPPLDPKWLRKSAPIVFPLLSDLLEKLYWELGEDSDVGLLWQTYVKSISSPAVKEIKVANDTMTSLACIFGFLHKIWNKGPTALNSIPRQNNQVSDSAAFLESFDHLTTTLLSELGHLPFVERQLAIGTSDNFLPVATPSQRPGKLGGQVKTPFHHLITLLVTPAPNLEYDQAFARLIQRVLTPFFECRKTKTSRIDLAKILFEMLPMEKTEPCKIIWQVIAKFTTSAVDFKETQQNSPSDQPLGACYKDLVRILEFGISIAPSEPLPGWTALLDATACSAFLDAGDAGKAISVVEPLSASLLKSNPLISQLTRLLHFTFLVGKAVYPKDRKALDVAGTKLWGALTNCQKGGSFDPFVSLYELCQISLQTSYASFHTQRLHNYIDMVAATTALLTRCPSVLCFGALINIQIGISFWVQDAGHNFSSDDPISAEVTLLLNRTYDIILDLQNFHDHSVLLSKFEILLCAGLESKHRNFVNMAIKFWNSCFGLSKQDLEYPDRLKTVLLGLRAFAEIELPSLPASLVSEEVVDQRQLMDFEHSQFDPGSGFSASGTSAVLKAHHSSHLAPSPMGRTLDVTPPILSSNMSLKRSRQNTPDLKERKIRKREITPRLRHDDSQVQFQPIDSSPIVNRAVDSQLLTDRQKEVKDRQQEGATMFQNIGSSLSRRSPSAEETDLELPVHRSSSLLLSAPRGRLPTPTLVAPSDDDGFVASSPTPTRSIRGDIDKNASIPSPSERAREPVGMDFDDIPSSPPEQQEGPDEDSTSSLLLSAQIDTSSLHQDTVVSLREGITDFNEVLSAEDINTADAIRAQLHVEAAIEGRDEARMKAHTHFIEGIEETILDSFESSKYPKQVSVPSPKVLHKAILDVHGSPASSDKLDGEEDVFEDALSSPRPHGERPAGKVISSSLSDLDEESIIRVLAEAGDQGQKTRPMLISDEENPHVHLRKSGGSPATSAISENFRFPASHGGMEIAGETSKKRKLDSTEDGYDVSDGPELERKAASPSPQVIVKRGHGRPRKHPRPSQEPHTSMDPRHIRSNSPIINMEEMEPEPPGQNVAISKDAALMVPPTVDRQILGEDFANGGGDEAGGGFELSNDIASAGFPAQSSNGLEVIDETTIGGSNWSSTNELTTRTSKNIAYSSHETSRELNAASANIADSIRETASSKQEESSMQVIEETRLISQKPTNECSAMDLARAQVQALMSVLKDAALTRGEVVELEDLFMDTKELLYGAARRGRTL